MANLIDPNGHFDMIKPDKHFPNKAYRAHIKAELEKNRLKSIDKLHQQAKTLKKFGFIDYDLRKKLSLYKLNKIKKLSLDNGHIVDIPTDFVKRTVSKQTKAIWQEKGYDVSKKYLIIPKNGYDKIHVSKDKITRRNYEKSENIYSYKGLDLYNQLHRLENVKLKQGEYITLKIGKNAMFASRFNGVADLMKYLSKWLPHDPNPNETKEDLIHQMSVVKFTDFDEIRNGYEDFSDYEDEEDEDY